MFRSWLLFIFVTGIVEVDGIRFRFIYPPTSESYDEMEIGILTQTATAKMDIDTDHLATTDESSYYMSEPTESSTDTDHLATTDESRYYMTESTEQPLMTTMDFTSQGFHYTPHEIQEVEFGSENVNSVYQNPMRNFYSVPGEITEDELITETVNSADHSKQLANLSVAVYTQLGIFVFVLILLCMTVVLMFLYYRKMREIMENLKKNIPMQDLNIPERAGPCLSFRRV